MKKRILFIGIGVALLACIAVGTIFALSGSYTYDYSALTESIGFRPEDLTEFTPLSGGNAPDKLGDMVLALETEALAFYLNVETTDFAIQEKTGGEVWYSNPPEGSADGLANKYEKERMASQLYVRYYNATRQQRYYLSYTDCTVKNQFEILSAPNGVRIVYTLGRLELGADIMPKYLTKERLDELLAKMSGREKSEVKSAYAPSKDKPDFLEMSDNIKSTPGIKQDRLMAGFVEQAGYTEEDLAADNLAAGYEMSLARDFVQIPVDYSLDESGFRVTIPCGQIESSETIWLSHIELLSFFGAANTEEDGYLFVPSGVGALINFNNGKSREEPYEQMVYGPDLLFLNSQTQSLLNSSIPVYGIYKKDADSGKGRASMVACITRGDSLASICADISGRTNSYNYAYASFLLREWDLVMMANTDDTITEMTLIQEDHYRDDLSVSYNFLSGEQSDYSAMAAKVRAVFLSDMEQLGAVQTNPLYLSVIGAQEKIKRFVGIPYDAYEVMTSYEQAAEIIDKLSADGSKNIQMRLMGWFNGGINHDVAKSVSLLGGLGSKSELSALDQKLQNQGGALYPDVQFQRVAYDTSNYSLRNEAARWLNGYNAASAEKSRLYLRTFALDTSYMYRINSPRVLSMHVDSFIRSFSKLGVSALSLRDLGSQTASDQKREDPYFRETAKLIAVEQLGKLGENYDNLMINRPNMYAFPYADHLIGVPMAADQLYIIDEEVPFLQMLLHGYADYAGAPVNIEDAYDYDRILLKMLEYGASPHYIVTAESSAVMSGTMGQKYYSTQIDDWLAVIQSQYQTVNEVNNQVRTAAMTGHIKHAEGVYETLYANGVSVYVNYTEEDAAVKGLTIPGKGYLVGGGA